MSKHYRKSIWLGNICPALTALVLFAAPLSAERYEPLTVHDVDLLDNGDLLVTDGGNISDHTGGGIFEIDRDGNVLWSFRTGLKWSHNADKQSDGRVVISDTDNDRVVIVNQAGTILWSSAAVSLSDGTTLNYPNDANLLDSGNLLITDRDNHRVIEITPAGNKVWQFGLTGAPGSGTSRLNGPHNADRLANGNTVIADSNNNRIIEVNAAGSIVWTYAIGLNWPRDADRLASGNTLVNDSNNRRIIEVTAAGGVVWSYTVTDMSYDSDRLAGGSTLISTGARIIEVDAAGLVVWSYPVTYQTEIIEGYLVIAPDGNQLWTKIIQPRSALYPGQVFPAVVNVPGGLGAGENGTLNIAASGFVEFHFNAEGRGIAHPSGGAENHNGFVHQDDLKAVIEFAYSRSNVAKDNIGVCTNSLGISMGAGCLGRYPDLPVKYLVDNEGPSDNYVISFEPWSLDGNSSNDKYQSAYQMFGHYSVSRDPSPANVAWWSEREATRYIGGMRCRYLRAQAQWDHAQPPNAQWPAGWDYPPLWYPCKHGIDLVNLATEGRAEWTRVNRSTVGNVPNTLYGRESPPVYYSGRLQDHQGETPRMIREMAYTLPRHGDLNRDGYINLLDLDGFVAVVLRLDTDPDQAAIADMNGDGSADGLDVQPFVDALLP
jgi:hypothetical protein